MWYNIFVKVLDIIKTHIKNDNLYITQHADSRMHSRGINYSDIYKAINNGIIIEEYLDDKPYPSYLICGKSNNRFIHVLLSDDGENSYLITTYIPDKELWNEDFTKRR